MNGFNSFLFNLIHGMSGRGFLTDAAGVFTAQYLPYLLFFGFIWFVFLRHGWHKKMFLLSEAALALIISRGLATEIIRFFYDSPRPFEALNFQSLIPESGNSLPSGHAAFFFALSMVIYFWDRRWGTLYFAASLLVCLARIFSGVHWPLDVVAGAVVGILSGVFVHRILSGYLKNLRDGGESSQQAAAEHAQSGI